MSYALRLGRLARIAGRYVPTNGSCLRQSLLVWWLLRRKGVPAELRIGVRTQEGFTAHAWVEVGGQPVNDAADVAERFAAFDDSLSARLISSP
jgi:transglutaminase-like putative cysteine protease